jgi:hypothetical protein
MSGSSSSGGSGADGGDATVGDGGIVCGTYVAPACGLHTCDLRTNDCCGEVTFAAAVSCDAGTEYLDSGTCIACSTGTLITNTLFCQVSATCNPRSSDGGSDAGSDGGSVCQSSSINNGHDNVSVACASACDCSEGQVCCADHEGLSANTSCQTVGPGGSCPDADAGAGAQFCKESSECTNSQPCLAQTCLGALVYACGLQTQDPFDCTPGAPPEEDAGTTEGDAGTGSD